MSREAALDQWFEPLEEDPKQNIPPGVDIRAGDLTEWQGVDAIVHQCNCLAVKAHGLSVQIARKYPGPMFTVTVDVKDLGTWQNLQIERNPGPFRS